MNHLGEILPAKCTKCKYVCDTASNEEKGEKPSSGDFSICLKCGEINRFNDELQFVKPTNAFMLSFADEEPDFYLSLIKMQAEVKKSNVLGYYK